MSPFFWTPETPTARQLELYNAVLWAHHASAQRGNVSTTVMMAAAQGSGSLTQAIASALNTLGGIHAPIAETYKFIQSFTGPEILPSVELFTEIRVHEILRAGRRVPGWGNSFFKGEPDPLWEEVSELLYEMGNTDRVIGALSIALSKSGKRIYPNPSAFTAAAAIELGMPAALAPWLFVIGRLPAWAALFHHTTMSPATTTEPSPQIP